MNNEKQKRELSAGVLEQLYWKNQYSLSQIAKEYGINTASVLKRMKKHGIKRRSLSESGYLFHGDKPVFKIKKTLNCSDEKVLVAGTMLYWAEGTLKRDTVDFANSNPEIIKVFLKFLREICGINESRLRAYLYIFSDQDVHKIRKYWEEVTKIPEWQFIKPFIRETKSSNGRKRRMEYGLVKIRYSDKKLLSTIRQWIEKYTESL